MSTEKCDDEIFKRGHSICALDACKHRAELFAREVASLSGQRVDWHYSGGIANVLYIGDHSKVAAAVRDAEPLLGVILVRRSGECGSCPDDEVHRYGAIVRRFGPDAHGLYRAGDDLPPGTIAVGG